MARKIFIISGIIFVLAGIALAVFRFMPSRKVEVISNNADNQPTITEKSDKKTGNNKISEIIEGNVKGANFSEKDNSIIYYNNKNFLKSDANGIGRNSLATFPFNDVKKIIWSDSKDKVIVNDGNVFYLVHLDENKTEKMKDGIDEAVFDTSGNKIIYKYYQYSNGKRSINISDLNGQNWRELIETSYKEISLSSRSNTNSFLYFRKPQALEESILTLYDFNKNINQDIFSGKLGADYLWSPKGDKILISFTLDSDKSKLSLGVMNADGGQFQGLNFPTSIKKCVWSKDNVIVFCAMMNDFPSSAILPDDWQNGKYFSTDTFWKIDTSSGKKERIIDLADLNEEIDGFNLFLNNEENNLFLINKKDGGLYKIEI